MELNQIIVGLNLFIREGHRLLALSFAGHQRCRIRTISWTLVNLVVILLLLLDRLIQQPADHFLVLQRLLVFLKIYEADGHLLIQLDLVFDLADQLYGLYQVLDGFLEVLVVQKVARNHLERLEHYVG